MTNFVQSQSFRVFNRGTSAAPGNGVPFYKNEVLHQTRYHRGYSWSPAVLYGYHDTSLPFQIWLSSTATATAFRIMNYDGTTKQTLNAGTDLNVDCFGTFNVNTHFGQAVTLDCGEWNYYEIDDDKGNTFYSELWQNIDSTEAQYEGYTKLSFTNWESATPDPDNFLDYIFYGMATEYRPYFVFPPAWSRPFVNEVNDSFLDGNEQNHYTFRKVTEIQRFSVIVPDCLLHQMHAIGKHNDITFFLTGDTITYQMADVNFIDESDPNDYLGKGEFQFQTTPFMTTACKNAPLAPCP